MPPQVAIEAGLLERGNYVNILAGHIANSSVELLQGQRVFFGSEFTPTPLKIRMRSNLVSRSNQVINDCSKGDSRTHPFCRFFQLAKTAEYSRAADQKYQAEKPPKVPVELKVSAIQLNSLVNIESCFVSGAAITHESSLLIDCLCWCRLGRRVSEWWDLRLVINFVIAHESSLLSFWMLGSPKIVARELSPMSSVSSRLLLQIKPKEIALGAVL